MPVLLVAAELDDIGSLEGQRRLAALIPSSTLAILPGVGHLVHYEKPDEAARLITDFLAGVPAADAAVERCPDIPAQLPPEPAH